ncbi:MAG TPA: hypothetical protein VMR02_06715 [Terracidiphilus sp.]|jgi:hypothetical protein|nr:hypothetical protein [Terracidiphilus sp.]
MSKVTVYHFEKYDLLNDHMRKSRRWGTREAIEKIHGHVPEDTATEVDESVVIADDISVSGLTSRDFDPHPRGGFQNSVPS